MVNLPISSGGKISEKNGNFIFAILMVYFIDTTKVSRYYIQNKLRGPIMNPNETQVKMMLEIERGEIELPKNKTELFNLVKDIVTAYDFNTLEKPLIEKCVDQFIRISINSPDAGNWVYISEVKNVLKKRNYYKELCKSMSNRGIKDPSIVVAAKMIENGLLLSNDKKVAATLKAEKLIEESDSEFRNMMNKARLEGKQEC